MMSIETVIPIHRMNFLFSLTSHLILAISIFHFPPSLYLSLGTALMGTGHGKGKLRATDAALSAISSPLLGFPISQARGIVFNIVGGPDMTLQEINRYYVVCGYVFFLAMCESGN